MPEWCCQQCSHLAMQSLYGGTHLWRQVHSREWDWHLLQCPPEMIHRRVMFDAATWCTQVFVQNMMHSGAIVLNHYALDLPFLPPNPHHPLTLLPGWSKTTKYSSRSGSLASLPAPSGLPPTEDRHLIISASYLVSQALPGVDWFGHFQLKQLLFVSIENAQISCCSLNEKNGWANVIFAASRVATNLASLCRLGAPIVTFPCSV